MEAQGYSRFDSIRLGLVTAAFLFVMLAFTPVAHAGGLGFAPLALITGIAGYVSYFRLPDFKQIPGVFWALALFLLWAVTTSIWSPYQDSQSLTNPVKLIIAVAFFVGTFLLIRMLSLRRWAGGLVLLAAAVMLGLLAFDLHSDYALSKYFFPLDKDLPEATERVQEIARSNSIYQNLSHSIIVLALMLPLVTMYLIKSFRAGPILAVLAALLFAYLSYKANVTAGLMALCAASIFMGLVFVWGRRALDLFTGVAILSILFAPLLGYFMNFVPASSKDNMPDSWEHRVEMWGYVAEKVAEKPIFGHGFDASRTFDKTYTGMSVGGEAYEQTIVSLHPHNAGLHIWVETGAIGASLACLAIFMLRQALIPAIRGDRGTTFATVGFLAASLTICTFTYGIWQEWFWGVLILIGALIPMSNLNAR